MTVDDDKSAVPGPATAGAPIATPAAAAVPPAGAAESPAGLPDVGPRYIWLQVLAQFGVFVAFITPLGISLAIRVGQLAPGHDEYLGYITAAGAFAALFTGPVVGQLSDRTRSRWGRRRPFMVAGMLLGTLALTVMATAPTIWILGLGWVLSQMTWGTVLGALQFSQADKLPEHQRGRVAGLTGFATQIAPVLGVGIASVVSSDNLMLFLIPGAIGLLCTTLFVALIPEPDSRGATFAGRMTLLGTFRDMAFDPRTYPDFAWNWLARFLFYFGLTLNTTFTAFFFASKLDVDVADVAPTLSVLALFGIVAVTAGAIGGGFLSDRLQRRRVFVLAAGILFGVGAVVMAVAGSLPLLMAGSLTTSLGIGMFSAVDQALALDVLPDRAQAGRFIAIMNIATAIAQAVAPLVAPSILTIGVVAGGEKNYVLLYAVAAVFTIAAGASVLRVKAVR